MNKSLYIDIPEELYEKLRAHCFQQNTTKREVVVGALEKYLAPRPQSVHLSPNLPKPAPALSFHCDMPNCSAIAKRYVIAGERKANLCDTHRKQVEETGEKVEVING